MKKEADKLKDKFFGKKGKKEDGSKDTGNVSGKQHKDNKPDDAEKRAVAIKAKVIIKLMQSKQAPISELISALNQLKGSYSWIISFEARSKGDLSHYSIWMIASEIYLSDYTLPSCKPDPNALPKGTPARIKPDMEEPTKKALQKENESAEILAKAGYDIEQLRQSSSSQNPGKKNPDYKIEGRIFDHYAPTTKNPRNIWTNIKEGKIDAGQTDRIILNLDNSKVSIDALKKQFQDYPIENLREVKVIKNGEITNFWP
jgi:hypothetical protein